MLIVNIKCKYIKHKFIKYKFYSSKMNHFK